MSLKTRLSVLVISTPVLAFVLVGGFLGHNPAASNDEQFQHLRVFQEVMELVMNNYVAEVKPDKAMEGAIRGLAEGLDPDSAYLAPELMKALETGEPKPEGDVGLELTRQYYLRVIAARDSSPAAKANLQTGDYIRAIDGKPTRDLSVLEGDRLLRGKPGTKVTLTVIRGNAADPHELTLVREKMSTPIVSGRMLDGGIGYVRVVAFHDGAAPLLRRQAGDLLAAGAKSLIVDVRRTSEGSYANAIEAARLFVKSGTLAVKAGREKGGPREEIAAKPGDGAIDAPLTLLVTTGTSGPAEVFVAALEGNDRAQLVGERTLGRAGVQKIVKLPEGRGLWLTYARYLRPNNEQIHGRGIHPDVEVEEPSTEFGAAPPDTDPILDAAVARIAGKR